VKLAILIPAYDAAATLPDVLADLGRLARVRAGEWARVVVDDGSRDATAAAAGSGGAIVLAHARNMGKGAALATGFSFALSGRYDAVVTMDADGQHAGGEVPLLVDAAERLGADIVVGSRMHDVGRMPPLRIFSNRTTSAFVSRLAGQPIRDSQSGFRFIRCEVLRQVRLTCRRYDAESELLIEAGRMGFVIREMPVRTVYSGGASHIDHVRDTWRFLRLVGRSLAARGRSGA